MKRVNNYWIDENNNRWLCEITSEDQAIVYSNSLIDCRDCRDCRDCSDCSYCSYCSDCSYCSYCSDCSGCSYCSYCSDCSGCSYCRDCRDCRDCSYCSYCRGYEKRPIQYITSKIGSRNDNTIFYYDGVNNLQVVCGCFRGNLDEFEKAVIGTHKNNVMYLNQYLKEIEKVKVLFELNGEE